MSALLRKKIEARTGLPPSLLAARDFWREFSETVAQWVDGVFGQAIQPGIGRREGLSANGAAARLADGMSFVSDVEQESALMGVKLERRLALAYAARRLQTSPEKAEASPPLFLKLLMEEPVRELWRSMDVFLSQSDTGPFVEKLKDADADCFASRARARFLSIPVTLALEEGTSTLGLLLDLDIVQDRLAHRADTYANFQQKAHQNSPQGLRRSVRTSSLNVTGIVDQLKMSIGSCSRLSVGQMLPLPDADRSNLALSVLTVTGHQKIGTAELGTWQKNRALKLTAPIFDSFLRNVSDLSASVETDPNSKELMK